MSVAVDLDGGDVAASTGVPFFDHMLDQLGQHGGLGLADPTQGDLEIDAHHTVEDTGIALGEALSRGAGGQAGHPPVRGRTGADGGGAGSGRARHLGAAVCSSTPPTSLPRRSVSTRSRSPRSSSRRCRGSAGLTLHITLLEGRNAHHSVEAIFKAFARALSDAVSIDPRAGELDPVDQRLVSVKVAVLDHGMGNLRSVAKALEAAGAR